MSEKSYMKKVQEVRQEKGVSLKEAHRIVKETTGEDFKAEPLEKPSENPLDYKVFYHDVDKGASRPSFCYPRQKANLEEDVRSMKANIDGGFIPSDKRMYFKQKMELKAKRLEKINESEEESRRMFEKDKDRWIKRRAELAEKIKEGTPSKQAYKEGRVSPYDVVRREKEGKLGEMKKEFIILSRLAGEPSDVRFLQRER